MKSKALVLILGESFNDQGDVGFFVPTLEMPFFGPSIWPLLLKVPELGPQKKALSVPVQKSGTWVLLGHYMGTGHYLGSTLALLICYFGTTWPILWH